ncbi:Pycsar system effector family protein [Ahrensia sp. 13_GOM-1096m]|uniref:Pycsar system effector family protein n=1 Tax=Ahrensia sp. 13_GOM-1096m TaxID=1380380 RepID=UPI00047CB50D|nr:Pycsar system effector family protein [Ahrensia sp. 13_GOM-1096m]
MKDLVIIEAQLTRVLSFFPRVDTKAAGLFTINSAILTLSAFNVEAGDFNRWYIAVPGAFLVIGLVASYTFIYKCNFPELKGGQSSLIYFSAIKERTETSYKTEFEAVSEEEYRADMIGQIWRNSHILAVKYQAIAMAIRLTLATLIPFAVFLVMTAIEHSRLPIVGN